MNPIIFSLGAAGEVTGSKHFLDTGDSLIMMDCGAFQGRRNESDRREGKNFNWKPLYDERDVVGAANLFVTMAYERPMFITRDVTATFYDAGHILGSAITRFEITGSGGKTLRLAYSGDLGRKNKPIIRDPRAIPPVDYMILESTYGDRLHEQTSDAMAKLADVVNRTVARGGRIIIPAFAIERTQELVFFLHLLTDSGKIPKLPIFVDSPMATNATGIFRIHPECYDEETNRAFVEHHENPFGFN